MILFKKTIIWPWGQRSHKGHYSTRHTTLWSCTYIPIIIDLSWKTKKLWSGQASLKKQKKWKKKQYVSLRSKGIHNKMLLNKPLTKDHFSCKVTFLCWSGGHIIGTTILSKLVFNCPLDTNSGKYSWLLINCKLETIANTSSNERTVSLL